MKKACTAKAIMLGLSGIFAFNNVNSEPPRVIQSITHSVEEIKSLASSKATAQDVFKEVNSLAESLNILNLLVRSHLSDIDVNDRHSLLLVNFALELGMSIIKERYEDEIYEHFFSEFKALASAKNTLEVYLRRIQERAGGIEIVRDPKLTLNQSNIEEIMSSRG